MAEHYKGSERYGHLNDDRAEREQPDFSLGLPIHGSRNAQRHGSFQGSRIWRASKATENARKRPERGWILSVAESADEPDRYGDESSANP
jgi:hypothetical protein